MGVGEQHPPGPPLGLLRQAHTRRNPGECLLEKAERLFEIEAPNRGAPADLPVGFARAVPAEPERSWLARLPGQLGDVDQDDRAAHERARLAGADGLVDLDHRVPAGPGAHLDLAGQGIGAGVSGGRIRPPRGVLPGDLGALATRPPVTTSGGRVCVGREAAVAAQADQERGSRLPKAPGEFDRVVTGVEDEERDGRIASVGAAWEGCTR